MPSVAPIGVPPTFVCSAPDRTYGTGAIPPGLHGMTAELADPALFRIDPQNDIFPTARYHWRFPSDGFVVPTPATDGLGAFYDSMATKNCPASVLMRFEAAVLSSSVIYCLGTQRTAVVYETYRPNDRAAVALVSEAHIAGADRARFADPAWQNLFIGSAGSSNYGHWLVDDLPRLKAFVDMQHADPRPIRVLIHSYGKLIDEIRIESIRLLLGAPVHIDLLDPFQSYYFSELYYPTPVTDHPIQKSPVAIDYAARAVLANAIAGTAPAGPSRLFVGRASAHGRMLTNDPEVREIVASRGFTVIDPEGMSFVEQVRLFAGAQVVIGQMGAAMTNVLFCRPTTTTVYLAPSGWIEPFYWDLAFVRGHHYRVLFGDVADPEVPPHQSDFSIDRISLNGIIDRL